MCGNTHLEGLIKVEHLTQFTLDLNLHTVGLKQLNMNNYFLLQTADDWNGWSRCNRPCGGGIRMRSGLCRGEQCGRIIRESEACNTDACPGQGIII